MKQWGIFFLTLVGLAVFLAPGRRADADAVWPPPITIDANAPSVKTGIIEGLQITATLDKRMYSAGTPVLLIISLKNTTQKTIALLYPDENPAARLNVIVQTADQKQAPLTARADYAKPDFDKPYQRPSFPGRPHYLEADASYRFVLQPNIVYDMTQTGDYYVVVKLLVPNLDGSGAAVLETKPMRVSVGNPAFNRSDPLWDNPEGEE